MINRPSIVNVDPPLLRRKPNGDADERFVAIDDDTSTDHLQAIQNDRTGIMEDAEGKSLAGKQAFRLLSVLLCFSSPSFCFFHTERLILR